MNGLINTIKKFITNKSTVTFIGIIAGIIVLWGFYSWRLNKAVKPREVPYAVRTLGPKTMITSDDIAYMKVSSKTLENANVYEKSNVDSLIGKYVDFGVTIPEGSMFYQNQCVEKSNLPDSIFDEIPAGYRIFQLELAADSTYYNLIKEHSKIDLKIQYSESGSDNDTINIFTFIKDIEVLKVRDGESKDLKGSKEAVPSLLLFAVSDEYYGYLISAQELKDVKIIPVPRSANSGEISKGRDEAIRFLESRARFEIE